MEFPIDNFRPVASWMSEMERRLNALEAEVTRLDKQNKYQAEQIKELELFKRGVQIVMRKAIQEAIAQLDAENTWARPSGMHYGAPPIDLAPDFSYLTNVVESFIVLEDVPMLPAPKEDKR